MPAEGFTKQGVRNLNDPPKNNRKVKQTQGCFHDYQHDRECTGCWAENFGGYERASHTETCTKCGNNQSTSW